MCKFFIFGQPSATSHQLKVWKSWAIIQYIFVSALFLIVLQRQVGSLGFVDPFYQNWLVRVFNFLVLSDIGGRVFSIFLTLSELQSSKHKKLSFWLLALKKTLKIVCFNFLQPSPMSSLQWCSIKSCDSVQLPKKTLKVFPKKI